MKNIANYHYFYPNLGNLDCQIIPSVRNVLKWFDPISFNLLKLIGKLHVELVSMFSNSVFCICEFRVILKINIYYFLKKVTIFSF
jgi:hypothetical protein